MPFTPLLSVLGIPLLALADITMSMIKNRQCATLELYGQIQCKAEVQKQVIILLSTLLTSKTAKLGLKTATVITNATTD